MSNGSMRMEGKMNKVKRLSFIAAIMMLVFICIAGAFPVRAYAYTSTGKLKAPVIRTLTKADNGFKIISNKNSKAKGYQIRYSTSITFAGSKSRLVGGKTLNTTVSGLKEYKKYYVKIRAYKKVNDKRKYGKWSKTKKITTSGKPFDGYYAYTRYHQTTLYKRRSLVSGSITLWYNTRVYVSGVRKIAGVKWIRVSYKKKTYYLPATSLSQKLKKEGSQYVYFGKNDLEDEIIHTAMDIYLNRKTKYDYTHKAAMGVSDNNGVYPFDCSALAAYILNSTMQKYCPAYNASRGVQEEYYNESLINSEFAEQEYRIKTVCTGTPVTGKLRAGDILFFRQSGGYPVDHVGIYLGNGEFMQSNGIYTRYPGDSLGGVNIAPLKGFYKSAFICAKRFIPATPAAFKELNKVLVRKTAATVYSDVKCAAGTEKYVIQLPEGAKSMEIPVLYTGNRYYKDDKVTSRCAYVEYLDEGGNISHGFIRINANSVIRDPSPVVPEPDVPTPEDPTPEDPAPEDPPAEEQNEQS